jgi:hypothetical protein
MRLMGSFANTAAGTGVPAVGGRLRGMEPAPRSDRGGHDGGVARRVRRLDLKAHASRARGERPSKRGSR